VTASLQRTNGWIDWHVSDRGVYTPFPLSGLSRLIRRRAHPDDRRQDLQGLRARA
jgi:hypothetical protein